MSLAFRIRAIAQLGGGAFAATGALRNHYATADDADG